MIALTSHYLWFTTRAAGIVTLGLFTIVMVLGIMTATRVGGKPMPRFAVAELHRRISLLACVFLALHIVTSVIDSYVNISVFSVFVPFTSTYKTLWVGVGTVSLDLLLAVMITSLLRTRMSHELWRTVHWISYLAWPIAIIHTIFIGTDIRFGWMDLYVAANVGIVLLALIWRVKAHPHPDGALTAVPSRTAPTKALRRKTSTTGMAAPIPGAQAQPAQQATQSAAKPTGRPVASSKKKPS